MQAVFQRLHKMQIIPFVLIFVFAFATKKSKASEASFLANQKLMDAQEKEAGFFAVKNFAPFLPLIVDFLTLQFLFFPLLYFGDKNDAEIQKFDDLRNEHEKLTLEKLEGENLKRFEFLTEQIERDKISNKLFCRSKVALFVDRIFVFDALFSISIVLFRFFAVFKSEILFIRVLENATHVCCFLNSFFNLKTFSLKYSQKRITIIRVLLFLLSLNLFANLISNAEKIPFSWNRICFFSAVNFLYALFPFIIKAEWFAPFKKMLNVVGN